MSIENISIIISILLSAAAFVLSIVTFIFSVRHQRKKDTVDAFNLLQNEALDPLLEYTKKQIESVSSDPRGEEYKTVSRYLYRIEHFSVGVYDKIYDMETLKKLVGTSLIYIYRKLEPVIQKKRQLNDEGDGILYSSFEQLANDLMRK